MKSNIVTLEQLYVPAKIEIQTKRCEKAIEEFKNFFGIHEGIQIFSAPGRTEIGGNHTDHNCGKVLAASVDMDVIAIVVPTEENTISVKSEGYPLDAIDLSYLNPFDNEKNTSAALIRGVAAGFSKNGYKVGGFKAYTTSNVLKGSGLSSSAAFENLIGTILSHLYNNGKISSVKIAQISQFAENKYFGKPSGLMDQMASSVGGFVAIDFKEIAAPIIENLNFNFADYNYTLCIIDTKGDHADLTDEYSAIPLEMKSIANFFSCDCLRQLSKADIILNLKPLRASAGDRAVLRALHFYDENERVDKLYHSLKSEDITSFLNYINESGNSSFKYLQNIYSVSDFKNQAMSVGLYLAENSLRKKGASRVHGGGFAGTIQAFVPNEILQIFKMDMENAFGLNSCHILNIRSYGGVKINL